MKCARSSPCSRPSCSRRRCASASAQHDLDQTELRAPFAGIVTERLAQRGEYVATGAAIAHLVDTVHLEARVQAPLTLVGLVRPDMELPVKIGDRQMQASVRTVVPVGEERSRQFELRLTLANSALSVGTPIEVGLPEREAADALVVPRDAIAVRQDGNYLMRVRADNTAEKVAVTSVATDGDLVTIRGPVAAGDLVVVRGVERLQHGQRVTVLTRAADVRGAGGRIELAVGINYTNEARRTAGSVRFCRNSTRSRFSSRAQIERHGSANPRRRSTPRACPPPA